MKFNLKVLGAAGALAVLLSGCAYPYYDGYYGGYRGNYSAYAAYPAYGYYDYGYPWYGYYGAPVGFGVGLGYYGTFGRGFDRGRGFAGRGFAGGPGRAVTGGARTGGAARGFGGPARRF